MDFKKFAENAKKTALDIKNKASEHKQKAIDFSAKKLSDSKNTINIKKDLDTIIEKSQTTTIKNKETWIEKKINHRSIVIFADEGSDFFKEALFVLPIMATKAFTQNISLKLAKSKIKWVKLSDYKVKAKTLPCLVVFENKNVIKTIEWSDNILKLVKSFNLNINVLIDKA